MGLSTAGLAFKATSSTPEELEMVRRAFGQEFAALPLSAYQDVHDVRIPGKLAVEARDGVVFIYGSEFAERFLFGGEALPPSLLPALGNPEVVLVFCHYDAGDAYGYLIVEHGRRVRSRIHVAGETHQVGMPKAFEMAWIKAEPFVEEEGEPPVYRNAETGETCTESDVTASLLDAALGVYCGGAPWHDWNHQTRFVRYARQPAGAAKPDFRNKWTLYRTP